MTDWLNDRLIWINEWFINIYIKMLNSCSYTKMAARTVDLFSYTKLATRMVNLFSYTKMATRMRYQNDRKKDRIQWQLWSKCEHVMVYTNMNRFQHNNLYYYKNQGCVCVFVCLCVMFMQATFPLMDQLHILHNHRSWPWGWPMAI